jgi:hypothetical protein
VGILKQFPVEKRQKKEELDNGGVEVAVVKLFS